MEKLTGAEEVLEFSRADMTRIVSQRLKEDREKRGTTALLKERVDLKKKIHELEAANEGYRAANRDAVKRGILDPDEWEREWLGTPDGRICSICAGLVGARADLPSGDFDRGGGRGPPRHPRCRCCEIIVPRRLG